MVNGDSKTTLKSLEKEYRLRVSEIEEIVHTLKESVDACGRKMELMTDCSEARSKQLEDQYERVAEAVNEGLGSTNHIFEDLEEEIHTMAEKQEAVTRLHADSIEELRTRMEREIFPRMNRIEASITRCETARAALAEESHKAQTMLGAIAGLGAGLAAVLFAITLWVVL